MPTEHVLSAVGTRDGLNPAVGQEFMASIKGRVEESEVPWQQDSEFENFATCLPPTKLISLQRQSNGFGFTLRHFVVYPPELIRSNETGLAPLNGLENHVDDVDRQKVEPMDTVFVRQVAPSGPADRAGLSTGDQIVSVNGHPVIGRSYSQVIQLIQSSQALLELGIIPKEDCVLQMVTPIVSVPPPKITGSVCEFSQTPPAVKPKPTVRRLSNQESPARVMSTVTINPTNSYHLKLSDKDSESLSVSDSCSPVASVTLRRGSVDRTAMENRSFVITSENVDYSSNLKSRSSSAMEGGTGNSPPMDGSYFMATTDSMGRPFALHFEKGSKFGNTLPVLEDPMTKNRSLSLPMVQLANDKKAGNDACSDSSDENGAKSLNGSLNFIPPFTLSAPRTVVSDGPSTTYVSTNSDVGSRQPVAANPGYRTGRPSYEASTSHLIRTIASHMRKDRQGALRSSTVGTTLLESKDGEYQRSHGSSDSCQQSESVSTADEQQDTDSPHPAKVRRQSHDNVKQATFSSEVSMFPNKPTYDEMVLTASFGAEVSVPDTSGTTVPAKHGSPKPRRVSYLMATSGAGETSTPADQKVWGTAPLGRRPGKPTVWEGLSTTLQPVMVHVSSGMELCEDSNREEGLDIPPDELAEDEVFQGSAEEKNTDGSCVQKSNRRISYVMATSSPTSPRHQTSFEALKEDVEEEKRDAVHGMEVHKEGFLWRKFTVNDGGKIFQRSSAKSWKLVFAVLRGHVLCLYKDEAFAHQEDNSDEQPISIKSSLVDIAHDYTKKKNVFRLTTFNGSGCLFQAENHESMMSWITAIKENSNPDEDESGVTSQSLIIRRMKTVEQETSGSNSSPPSHKLTPPINTKISSIPGISNIKKSISFRSITTGQKGDSGKSQGNKATKKRKKPPVTNTYPSGHSVGVPLEMCPPSKKNKFIPLIVEHCCEVVERKGLETVGVYRVPGNSAAVTALVEELNSRGIENVCLEEDKWNDVNNITSLFKQFLRKLPEGVVTAELYDGFIEANKREDPVDRMWSLRAMVQDLPDHNFETLKLLTRHLRLVSENCDKNKMEVRNLAIVFGPTLVRTGDDSMMSLVKDMSDQCRIVETLISECEWFFDESDGDECPIKVPLTCQENVQGDILSQNVLCSLGQAAVNFGDDGSYKHKTSGKSLHIPKFRSSKSSKSDPGQGSSSDGVVSDSQGSEGSPPMERAPAIKNVPSDGSRSNSPTMERSTRLGGKKSADNIPAVQIVIDQCDTDFKPKGTGSLKAYSYAHPPPPSYRRVNQRRAASPGPTESLAFSPLEPTVTLGSEGEVKKSLEEVSNDVDSTRKPSFSSFSEETRLRLLKMSLQQKAAEKRRQSEREMQATSPPLSVDKSDDTARDLSRDIARDVTRKASDQENLENMELLSSSSNSRSSSTLSSKNPSLDSLHVIPQSDKVTSSTGAVHTEALQVIPQPDVSTAPPLIGPSEALRANNNLLPSSQTNNKLLDVKPRSYETVVAVIHGRGVVAGTPRQFEAALRPASSDIRARRESAEERRLAVGSESSDTSSDEEGESANINMDKSFNEKLRMLLDLENTFGIEGRGSGDLQNDEDKASVSSEPQKTRVLNDEDNVPRQVYDEPVVRTYQVVGRKPPSDSEKSFSRSSTSDYNVSIPVAREEHPLEAMNYEHSTERSATNHSVNAPDEECAGMRMSSSATQPPLQENPDSSKTRKVGQLRQRFEGDQTRSPRSSLGGEIKLLTKNSLDRHEGPPVARKKIGSVHTTTPFSLKEFNVRPASAKRNSAPGRDAVRSQQHDGSQRIVTSKSIRLESSPAKHSITVPTKYGMPRNEGGSVRSGISINLSTGERFRAQPSMSNTHVPPRVINREIGMKSKLLSHKDSTKELLPSKATIPSKDISGSQTRRKLEKDAQHIADLLQEMHSERDLFLSRQQSDISGQAQKAAAQRAAMRRRRRSLGDGNDSGVRKPTSPTERSRNVSGYNRTGMSKGAASHWPGDLEERKRLPHHGRAAAQSFTR